MGRVRTSLGAWFCLEWQWPRQFLDLRHRQGTPDLGELDTLRAMAYIGCRHYANRPRSSADVCSRLCRENIAQLGNSTFWRTSILWKKGISAEGISCGQGQLGSPRLFWAIGWSRRSVLIGGVLSPGQILCTCSQTSGGHRLPATQETQTPGRRTWTIWRARASGSQTLSPAVPCAAPIAQA